MADVRKTRDEDPRLIAAYIYHMYLGLWNTAGILRRKFNLPGQILDLDDTTNVCFCKFIQISNFLIVEPKLENGHEESSAISS